jgi:ABC-type multidrug transport system fused ATPase/permease subunit
MAPRKFLFLLLLFLGLLVGACEGAFILLVKSALAENSQVWQGLDLLLWMGLLVTLRTVVQIIAARFEVGAVFTYLANQRGIVLVAVAEHSVPLYRSPWRSMLTLTLNSGLDTLGQGMVAGFRCFAALAQALVLLPILLFFSWKLALGALFLAVPALIAGRMRASILATASKGWENSQAELANSVEDFMEGSEAHIGNGRLKESTTTLDVGLDEHAGRARHWDLAKAVFPPALEWFFFIALALLACLAKVYGRPEDIGVTGIIPFGALLLLLYRPIREWARHYPAYLLGRQAEQGLLQVVQNLKMHPLRRNFTEHTGKDILLTGIKFGYATSPNLLSDHWVLNDLDLVLDPTAITRIAGRNGSGKSSLLKLLAGVETAQAGEIKIPASLKSWPRPIGYLSQKSMVEPDWLEWSQSFRKAHPDDWNALDSILGLSAILFKAKSIRGLSGGERQRLCLARAFASPCGYLLLDEPTTWLSAEDRERILRDLLAFWRRRKDAKGRRDGNVRGLVLVSHEPFLAGYCSRTIHLDLDGQTTLAGMSQPESFTDTEGGSGPNFGEQV